MVLFIIGCAVGIVGYLVYFFIKRAKDNKNVEIVENSTDK